MKKKLSRQSNDGQSSPESEQIPLSEATSSADMTLDDYPQDCPKCDNAITLEPATDMEHSGDYKDIETLPSVHITTE